MSDPIIFNRSNLDRSSGQPNIQLQQQYIRPADPEEDDPYAAWDITVAKAITRVLLAHYRGHFWEVYCSRRDGIAWITIPLLMGNHKFVFKLRNDITPSMIVKAGGEILERFNMPRSDIDVASFLAAKKIAERTGQRPPE